MYILPFSMKLTGIILLTLCAFTLADGFRTSRQTPPEESATDEECCYPRPPQRGRALKKQLQKCCEFPANDIWEDFQEDVKACKERRKQELEGENAGSTVSPSTAAAAPPSTTTSSPPDEKDSDNNFEADSNELDDDDEAATEASVQPEAAAESQTMAPPMTMKKGRNHHGHHGRGKGGKRKFHGRGICVKEAMEKRGWAKEGVVSFETILKSTEKAANESAADWIPIVREAINNCSQQAGETKYHVCPRQMTPEKQAWRCIVNNSILKCPHFPQDNEYCQQLRSAHETCLALPEKTMQFRWCGSPRGKKHHKRQPQQ